MKNYNKKVILSLCIIILILFLSFLLITEIQTTNVVPIVVTLGLLLVISLTILIFLFTEANATASYKEVNDYYTSLRQSLILSNYKAQVSNDNESDSPNPTDILELMSINMKEIKDYYVLSKNMAKSSFNLSISMCLLGFTLFASSIISIFILNISIGSAIIPAIGGAIVEVVAGTSLIVYRQSLDQLNKYYEALHENERFLSVINLADKITLNKKDDIYMEIIRSQLKQKDTLG